MNVLEVHKPSEQQTFEALQGSIDKWTRIVAGAEEDAGVVNCPLCQIFFRSMLECLGCPVAVVTGKIGCYKTPYDSWATLCRSGKQTRRADTPEKVAAAQAEVEFLKSLKTAFYLDLRT